MAQASSAQREPSMEEILASIRRIIEDSDVEKRRDIEEAEPAFAAPANDGMERSHDIEAFRAEFHEPAAATSPFDAEPVAHAHAGASVIERRNEPPAETVIAPTHADAATTEPNVAGSTRPMDVAAADPAPAHIESETSRPVFPESVEAMELTSPENGAQAGAADAQPRTPLTSEQTGRQVAAAFGELSEAFAASRRRSFDEMAEEMLRPMLQDWLDNNLPHLVERLVREEIERIARG